MRLNLITRGAAASGLLACCLNLTQARAQENAAAAPASAPGDPAAGEREVPESEGRLQPFEVIGQQGSEVDTFRLDGPLEDLPRAVSIIPNEIIEAQNPTDITDLVLNDASTQPGDNYLATFTVRGFDATRATNGVPQALFSNNTLFNETTNIERVEVIKGPASIYFGDIKPGGIINRVTKKPLAETRIETSVTGGYGADGQNLIEGAFDITGPFLAQPGGPEGRLIGMARHRESFRDFIEFDEFFIAPSIRFRSSPETEILFEATYGHEKSFLDRGIPAVTALGTATPLSGGVAPIDRTVNLQEPDDNYENDNLAASLRLEHEVSERVTVAAQSFVQYNEETRNSTDFLTFAVRDTFDPFLGNLANGDVGRFTSDQFSENFLYGIQSDIRAEFQTGALKHNLVIGADVRRETEDADNLINIAADINIFNPVYGQPNPFNPLGTDLEDNRERDIDNYGIFIRDRISLLDERLTLLGGVRYDYADLKFANFQAAALGGNQFFDFHEDAVSPQGGAVFKVTETVSIYGSYSESFEAPDPSFGSQVNGQPPEPELAEQFEGGVRWQVSPRLQASLIAFHILKENVVVADPANLAQSLQIGEQESQGVELELRGELAPGWQILASATYNEAEVGEGLVDNPITGVTEDVAGNPLPNAPEWGASLASQYTFPEGSALEGFSAGAAVFYRGERSGDLNETYTLDEFVRVDANLAYRREQLEAILRVRNVFNNDYFQTANTTVSALPAAPVFAEASVRYRF